MGAVTSSGPVVALRYTDVSGWGAPITVDSGFDAHGPISAAPGICGDDALLAYGGSGELRVARVRGNAAEARSVGTLADDYWWHVSIATRPADAL